MIISYTLFQINLFNILFIRTKNLKSDIHLTVFSIIVAIINAFLLLSWSMKYCHYINSFTNIKIVITFLL